MRYKFNSYAKVYKSNDKKCELALKTRSMNRKERDKNSSEKKDDAPFCQTSDSANHKGNKMLQMATAFTDRHHEKRRKRCLDRFHSVFSSFF